MNYEQLQHAYEEYLEASAAENNMSVNDYLNMLVHNNRLDLHTLEVAELIKGYHDLSEINLQLSREGFLDLDGD